MKKFLVLCLVFGLAIGTATSQPNSFKYQTVVRDGGGEVVANQPISFQLVILQGNAAGTNLYTETHTTTTNQFGVANLEIGNGSVVSGDFAAIDWGADDYYLQIKFDINGGTNYLLAGTSQLMAVPYALYAKNSGGSSAWQATGDDIYFNEGKVGIGTDSPSRLFHISGGDALIETPEWADITIRTTTPGTDASLALRTATDGVWGNDNYWQIMNKPAHNNDLHFAFNASRKMTLSNVGYLGIGTDQPGSLLDIHGGTRFSVRLDNESRSKVGNLYSSDDTLALVSFGSAEISIDENNNNVGRIFRVIHNGDEELFRVQEDGKVGIGTSNPASMFHVKGQNFTFEDTLWSYLKIMSTGEGDPVLQLYANDDIWALHNDDSEGNKFNIRHNNSTKLAITSEGNMGIGTSSPHESARLEVNATDKGFLPPRMSNTQISNIRNPTNGLMVYSTSDRHVYVFNSTDNSWIRVAYDSQTITPSFDCGTLLTDPRDGKSYSTVQIGAQCWMAENLAYLPGVSPSSQGNNTDPYYYVYNYQGSDVAEAKATTNYQTYGVLYNWPASLDACPAGWHLPADAEWIVLTTYLGGESIAGGKIKETGTSHWNSPNNGATNSSGFTGLPGGGRATSGYFNYMGNNGLFWSSTEYSSSNAWLRILNYSDANATRGNDTKGYGFSVRCVRDL